MKKETNQNPSVLQSFYYTIADCSIEVQSDTEIDLDSLLPSFHDFRVEVSQLRPVISRVLITKERFDKPPTGAKLLSDISIIWGNRFKFFEMADEYVTTIMSAHSPGTWFMTSKKDFSQSTIHWVYDSVAPKEIISWLLMVTFAQSALLHKTILIHASVIERGKEAYAFLGKSGTGKSTHSNLWLKHINGSKLLNDDNPAVKIEEDGTVRIYGTPWSGKTPCYRNASADLRAIVRLKQAPHNKMSWKSGQFAFITLLPSCSALRWNQDLFASMADLVEHIVSNVAIGELECLPNAEAAYLSATEIKNA
ncbi:hypothetical protein [Sphingobacterium corticibacter]|uniref:Phosphoenolpyruvate carboxykinase n=1 Tax=Sphingobacterium corticibacter TaxID=2171749 RepID=A0A2T8HKI7_9SPHI|nr:hypothetical protein [Sphingobacterium corticibacter]PVH25822.1 hypothetical protein DC487_07770 [Sphingobacterium corticibacter]